ncbi:MAG: type II secretion system protein [Rhizobacter sp.]|nr:type II secretion system protein [Rhizobacter sp.]
MPETRTGSHLRPSGQSGRGVVLLALLLALALGGIALMAAADVWSLTRQRAREQELLFAGSQIRLAIQRYYFGAPPGTTRMLPASLQDLLEDDRYPMPVRHLRRLYPDPITGSTEWGTLRVAERIAGVYSLSEKQPVKQAGFGYGYEHFNGRAAYTEWVFSASVPGLPIGLILTPAGTPAAGAIAPPDSQRPARRTTP